MTDHHQSTDGLHGGVYIVIMGLACLFAIGAWGFADAGYTELVAAVVTGLIGMAIAIPITLALAGDREKPQDRASFRDWMRGEFETSSERLKGSQALVQILLPIAAVSFGIAMFAILVHVVPGTGS